MDCMDWIYFFGMTVMAVSATGIIASIILLAALFIFPPQKSDD